MLQQKKKKFIIKVKLINNTCFFWKVWRGRESHSSLPSLSAWFHSHVAFKSCECLCTYIEQSIGQAKTTCKYKTEKSETTYYKTGEGPKVQILVDLVAHGSLIGREWEIDKDFIKCLHLYTNSYQPKQRQ